MPRLIREGQTIEYDVSGSAEAPAVICAHNLLCDRSIFEALAAALAPRRRVLTVDLRGHGGSRGTTREFSTRDLANDLVAVLDDANVGRATFVGVSIGAAACMEAALAHPKRVEKLVLMGASARAAPTRDRAKSAIFGRIASTVGMRPLVVRATLSSLFGRTFRAERTDVVDGMATRVASLEGQDVERAFRAWASRPSLVARLAAIDLPALVLVGEEDTACPPSHAEEIQRAIRGSRLVRVPRAGHTLPLERPREVIEAFSSFS